MLAFLRKAGPIGTDELKRFFPLWGKTLSVYLDELLKELLVTAVQRDRTLNESWCTFLWAGREVWEANRPPLSPTPIEARRLLAGLMTEKQAERLLSR